MGVLNSSRTIIYCGAKSWKFASVSTINTKISFSSNSGTFEDKKQSYSCSPLLSNKTVTLLKSAILKTRFNSSDVTETKNSGFFGPDAAIDKTGTVNRWSMFVPAFLTHLCKSKFNCVEINLWWDKSITDSYLVDSYSILFIKGLGAPYGWSAISASLTREFGFVSSSAADWGLADCTYPMSIMVRLLFKNIKNSFNAKTRNNPSFKMP